MSTDSIAEAKKQLAVVRHEAFNVLAKEKSFEKIKEIFRAADTHAIPGAAQAGGKIGDFLKDQEGIDDVFFSFTTAEFENIVVEILINFSDGEVLCLKNKTFLVGIALNSRTVIEAHTSYDEFDFQMGPTWGKAHRSLIKVNEDGIRTAKLSLMLFNKLEEARAAFAEALSKMNTYQATAQEERDRETIARMEESISLGDFGGRTASTESAMVQSYSAEKNNDGNEFLKMGFWQASSLCFLLIVVPIGLIIAIGS